MGRECQALGSESKEDKGEELEVTVNNFWQEEHGWKWELLSSSLQASMLLSLAEMRINPQETTGEEFGWLDSSNKSFIV